MHNYNHLFRLFTHTISVSRIGTDGGLRVHVPDHRNESGEHFWRGAKTKVQIRRSTQRLRTLFESGGIPVRFSSWPKRITADTQKVIHQYVLRSLPSQNPFDVVRQRRVKRAFAVIVQNAGILPNHLPRCISRRPMSLMRSKCFGTRKSSVVKRFLKILAAGRSKRRAGPRQNSQYDGETNHYPPMPQRA